MKIIKDLLEKIKNDSSTKLKDSYNSYKGSDRSAGYNANWDTSESTTQSNLGKRSKNTHVNFEHSVI